MSNQRPGQNVHGPVRKITDPVEFARSIAKAQLAGGQDQPIACKGNAIAVRHGYASGAHVVFEVSDYRLLELWKNQMALPNNQRMGKKQVWALGDFRRQLSEKGAESFSDNQKQYLASIIFRLELGKRPAHEPSSTDELALRKRQVSAFFAFMRLRARNASEKPPDQMVEDFFTPALIMRAVSETRDVLKPYGLEGEAERFVYKGGMYAMDLLRQCLQEDYVPKEYARHIFHEFTNPVRGTYDSQHDEPVSGLPQRLRGGVAGVPLDATQTVLEILDTIAFENTGCEASVYAVSGGIMGSGKGGTKAR